MATDLTHIRKWYGGKALKVLDEYVLPTLAASEDQGYWIPGASRKVRAALNKQTVAQKWARANERKDNNHQDGDSGLLDDIMDARGSKWYAAKIRGGMLVHLMMFGGYDATPRVADLADKLRPFCVDGGEQLSLDIAASWVRDFIPVAELVVKLDAGRPKPEFVFAAVSPTVHANVREAMGIDFTTVRAPQVIWHKTEQPHPKVPERVIVVWIPEIIWPPGTRHNVSRFTWGSRAGNSQCEACGHAIKSNNWVPLVADTADGPISLWVGRDCAETLFGAKINSDAKIERPAVEK